MKEFDENQAVSLMLAAIGYQNNNTNNDAALEVLDLLYDYYDEMGELDPDSDEDETDINDAVSFIAKQLAKNGPDTEFSHTQLFAMVKAEIQYEESLI